MLLASVAALPRLGAVNPYPSRNSCTGKYSNKRQIDKSVLIPYRPATRPTYSYQLIQYQFYLIYRPTKRPTHSIISILPYLLFSICPPNYLIYSYRSIHTLLDLSYLRTTPSRHVRGSNPTVPGFESHSGTWSLKIPKSLQNFRLWCW